MEFKKQLGIVRIAVRAGVDPAGGLQVGQFSRFEPGASLFNRGYQYCRNSYGLGQREVRGINWAIRLFHQRKQL